MAGERLNMDDKKILCGANHYEQKFYINDFYKNLPTLVKEELKSMCVLFVEEVSGILILEFDDEGNLMLVTTAKESDYYYDEIGSRLKIKQLREEKRELFGQLEQYYDAIKDRNPEE